MPTLLINPLSLQQQCHGEQDVYACIQDFIAMLDYAKPAFSAKRFTLLFDGQLYSEKLRHGELFSQTINHLGVPPANQNRDEVDLKKLWLSYVKNHATKCRQPGVSITVSAHANQAVQGTVSGEFCNPALGDVWLGFTGHPVFNQTSLMAQPATGAPFAITHASQLAQIKQALPRYEYSDKHDRKIDKIGPGGVIISAMPLEDAAAQKLLLKALPCGKDFFAFDENRDEYYRFKPTHPDKNIYHGFRIKENEVPSEIKSKI